MATHSDDQLRQDLAVGFEYCYLHDDWVNPLDEALQGLSVEGALARSSPEATCIWEIVLHTAGFNENMVGRIETGDEVRPEGGNWPALPEVQNDVAWEAAKTRLSESFEALQETIRTGSLQKIQQSPYGLPDLLCRYIHAGYHLGQITKMREALMV